MCQVANCSFTTLTTACTRGWIGSPSSGVRRFNAGSQHHLDRPHIMLISASLVCRRKVCTFVFVSQVVVPNGTFT